MILEILEQYQNLTVQSYLSTYNRTSVHGTISIAVFLKLYKYLGLTKQLLNFECYTLCKNENELKSGRPVRLRKNQNASTHQIYCLTVAGKNPLFAQNKTVMCPQRHLSQRDTTKLTMP